MTGAGTPEPTLPEVAAEYPEWRCHAGLGLCFARHLATGTGARGEDPMDLRDQIRAAEARMAWAAGQAAERQQQTRENPGPPGG